MGSYFTNVQGRPDDMGSRWLRRRVTYNQSGVGTGQGVPVGAIEKGGVFLRAYTAVYTAFNAGTTNVLIVGDTADDDGLITAANSVPGTPGMKTGTGAYIAAGTEFAADSVVYVKFTQTGTAATAGDVGVFVEYVPAYNWSDNNGGQLA